MIAALVKNQEIKGPQAAPFLGPHESMWTYDLIGHLMVALDTIIIALATMACVVETTLQNKCSFIC